MLNKKSQNRKSEIPIVTSGKSIVRIFATVLIAAISFTNVKAQPELGCPYMTISGSCINSFNMQFGYSVNTFNVSMCAGAQLTFELIYFAGCGASLITIDASGGYPPCASSFPATSGPETMNDIVTFYSPWSCVFNDPGNYQYIFCFFPDANCPSECEGCATLNIEVTDGIPFTITGPKNNCPNDAGYSFYSLVPPSNYTGPYTGITWTMYDMSNANLFPSGSNIAVDFSSATFDNNGVAARLCATFETCCGLQEVCIPIYKCCECWGSESEDPPGQITQCRNVDNLSASDLLNMSSLSPYITGNGPFTMAIPPNLFILINGTFTVNVDFTFEDCPGILMAPEAKILIKSGVTLTLSSPEIYHTVNYQQGNATKIYAFCEAMWDGIYFEDNTASLIINPPPIVGTDNYTSIKDARNAIVCDDGAPFTIRWANFSNNNKDIVVNDYTGSGAHPGTVEHSVFTASTYPLLQYYTPNTTTLNPGLARTKTGIEINNVDEITIGAPGQPTLNNSFSNMDIGIYSTNSFLHSYNNWFSNMNRITACPNPLVSPCAPEGVGILSKSTNLALNVPALEVGSGTANVNNFNNVDDGIYAEGPQDIAISDNVFSNVKRGIYATRNFTRNIAVNNNTIDQFSTGIWAVNNPACYIELDHNTLNSSYPTIQQGIGIKAEEPQQNALFSSIVKIHDNAIRRIRTGIQATNLVAAEINNFNDIMFETSHPNTWNASYGIRVQNNNKSLVQDNTIYRCVNYFTDANPQIGWPPSTNCFPGVSTATDYTNKLIGISMERNSFCNIINNSTAYMGTGIRSFSSYVASKYQCNVMAYCQWMLWLDDSDPGQQGDQNTSQGNQWRSNFLTSGFNVTADVFGPSPTPTNQGPWYVFSTALPDAPQVMQPGGLLDLQLASNQNSNCSYPQIIGNDPYDTQKQLADLLAWTRDASCTLTDEGKFIAQVEIYKELLYDNSLMNLGTAYDVYLTDFYNDEANTDVGIMAHVRYNIDTKDYETAKSSNSTVTPDNQAEANEKTTNQIYLDTWAKEIYTFTQQQYTSLSDIAVQSPISGGPAVYTARVMLGIDYDDFGALNRLSSESLPEESYMNIYPNPANNIVNIRYSLGDNFGGELELTDLLGREVMKQTLNSAERLISISTKEIDEGVYFVSIKLTDETKMTEKLVITR